MDLQNQSNLERKKEMEEAEVEEAEAKLPREIKEECTPTKLPLPITSSSSPCSSPSHEFSFTISFHSPSAAKSPSTLSRCRGFDLAPADDIFFHGHLLPLQVLPRPPPASSPRSSRTSHGAPADKDGGQSCGDTAADAISSTNSSSSSSSAASSNGDAKERSKNKFLSSLFMGKWRKASEAGERDEEDEKKKKRRAFDAMSRLLKRYVSAVEPLFSFRGGRGRRGEPLRRRPYSFAGNPSAGAAAGRVEDWRRRGGELSAPASMRTSPANSGLLVASPPAGSVGGSSEESTMEELRSAIEAAIAHCKNSIAMKEEKCNC